MMDALLTPTTALLNSLLEDEAFDTPELSPGREDVFSKSFQRHGERHLERMPKVLRHKAQELTPPSSIGNPKSGGTGNGVEKDAYPAQNYSLFRKEIENRFQRSRVHRQQMREDRDAAHNSPIGGINTLSAPSEILTETHYEEVETNLPEVVKEISNFLDHVAPSEHYSIAEQGIEMSYPYPPDPNFDPDLQGPIPTMSDLHTKFPRPISTTSEISHFSPSQDSPSSALTFSPITHESSSLPYPDTNTNSNSSHSPKTNKDLPNPIPIKKPRKPRSRKQVSPAVAQQKREAFLSRNREAAGKCRNKKKVWVEQLNEELRKGRERNEQLRCEYMELVGEVEGLRGLVGQCISRGTGEGHCCVSGNKMAEEGGGTTNQERREMAEIIGEGMEDNNSEMS